MPQKQNNKQDNPIRHAGRPTKKAGSRSNQQSKRSKKNDLNDTALIANVKKPKQGKKNMAELSEKVAKATKLPKNGKLKIISLGGLNEIGKNMTVYEYGGDIMIVDCGVAFPDDEMLGIDLVIPDFSYLKKHRARVRGLVVTHGHEDHIGAIPYLLKELNIPVYLTTLTAGILETKLEEHNLLSKTKLIRKQAGDEFDLGCFHIEMINVNHSIADAVALAIHTPLGVCIHTGDFKLDITPVQGKMMDIVRLGQLGNEGVLALLPDSTNIERPGFTISERKVGENIDAIFKGCNQRIIVTTFASNVHRMQQIINSAAKNNRKVAIVGRSMENVLDVATRLGYLDVPNNVIIDIDDIGKYQKNKLCIITTGSQGESMSALYRMAFGSHKKLEIEPGDKVLISASPIPGNEKEIYRVINELFHKGADVVYEKLAELHTSGHACREELKLMLALTKPKYFIPLHGEFRHLKAHAAVAEQMGVAKKNIFISDIGRVIEITESGAKLAGTVESGRVLVDGLGVGDVGSVVLRDRKHLSEDGLIAVVLTLSADTGALIAGPDIVSRGFVYMKEADDMIEELKRVATDAVRKCELGNVTDWASIKGNIKGAVSDYLFQKCKRRPMVLPIINEI